MIKTYIAAGIVGALAVSAIAGGAAYYLTRSEPTESIEGSVISERFVQNHLGSSYSLEIIDDRGKTESFSMRGTDEQLGFLEQLLLVGDIIKVDYSLGRTTINLISQMGYSTLSNGMTIPREVISNITNVGGTRIYDILTELGGEGFKIIDDNDGKPYRFSRTGLRLMGYDSEGTVIVDKDNRRLERNYDMTYMHDGIEIPIWDPLGFRRTPGYRRMQEELWKTLKSQSGLKI